MEDKEEFFSKIISCGHCSNISQMKIIGSVSDMIEHLRESNFSQYEHQLDEGTIYNILKCPACSNINIISYYWAEYMENNDEIHYENIFPPDNNIPVGLPESILKAYKAAEKIKTIDVNAYAILLRRLLELVCKDRNARGKNLALMLKDLADRNEIPSKLVKVAKGLKDFGNIGAHAGIGELSEEEIPTITALCVAILEYIYSAPYLATIAETKLNKIRNIK